MSLASTQAELYRLLSGAETATAERLTGLVQGTSDAPAESRVEVYAWMYVERQVDALREDFPKLATLLGPERFATLCADYISAHPSEHPSLARLGRRLAEFVATYPVERKDLTDLVALEWARAEALLAPDAAAASPLPLGEGQGEGAVPPGIALSPESFARTRLTFVPSTRVLSLRHDVLPLWRALEDAEPPPPPRAEPTHVLVWRKGWDVFHVALGPEEADALTRAAAGQPLEEVCDAFAHLPDAAEAAFTALGSWLVEGLIHSFEDRSEP